MLGAIFWFAVHTLAESVICIVKMVKNLLISLLTGISVHIIKNMMRARSSSLPLRTTDCCLSPIATFCHRNNICAWRISSGTKNVGRKYCRNSEQAKDYQAVKTHFFQTFLLAAVHCLLPYPSVSPTNWMKYLLDPKGLRVRYLV